MNGGEERTPWMFPARRRHLLLTAERRKSMPPAKTLRALGLGRGMTLLDVGCGPGFFALPACRIVGPRGAVLACDTSPVMLKVLREGARGRGAENLVLRRSRGAALPFPDGAADMALLAFVAHEANPLGEMLAETRRVLRPGGRAVVMEWHKRPTEIGPPLWSRLRPPELRRALRAAGFAVGRFFHDDGDTYSLLARAKKG